MPKDETDGVSIVIPAYNEEGGIGPVLERLEDVMAESGLMHEIIVVDDGSEDGTAAIVAGLTDPIRVIRHEWNRGYGAALKTGIRNARFPLICITDADATYPNERIPELVNRHREEGFDMTVGSRTGENVAVPLVRKPAKWAIGKLANYIVGGRIPDINSGLRLFGRKDARRMFGVLPDGFSFTTTITLAMWTNDYKVDYVPVDYHKRVGHSKIRPIRDTLNFIQLILKMGLYFAPTKIFLPVSLLLLLAGVAWGFYSRFVMGRLADVSTLVVIMTGIQIGAIGLIAELINWRLPKAYRDNESE